MFSPLAVAALVCLAGSADAQRMTRFAFHGHHLGDTLNAPDSTEGYQADGDWICTKPNEEGLRACVASGSSRQIVREDYAFFRNRLMSVTVYFDPSDYDDLVVSFTGLFGFRPTKSTSPFRTVGGARDLNQTASWAMTPEPFTLFKYASKLTQGLGIIREPRLYAAWEAAHKQQLLKALRP